MYADNVLLYVDNAIQCITQILSTFNQFGKRSGFKMNWQESALLTLNQTMINAPVRPYIPVVKIVTYLGVEMFPLIYTIPKQNYGDTL